MKYVVPFIILLAISCKSQRTNLKNDDRLVLVVQDAYFPIDSPETQVIDSEKALNAFYSRMNRTRKPGLPVPKVDFKTERVLLVCMGETNTDSLPIMFVKTETEDQLVISVGWESNSADTAITTYPICVYTVTPGDKEVILEMEE